MSRFIRSYVCGHRARLADDGAAGVEWCEACRRYVAVSVTDRTATKAAKPTKRRRSRR